MKRFSISFIIPKRPEENIEKTMDCVVKACEKNDILFEIILSEGNHPTYQRSDCIKLANFDYIYFLDNDSEINAESLKHLVEFISKSHQSSLEIDAIGGPTLLIDNANNVMKGIDAILSHPFVVGKVANRYSSTGKVRESDSSELILCNLVIRRLIFDELNSFEKKLYPGEEVDFIMRLLRYKKKVFYHPKMTVKRPQRETLWLFIHQMFRYGVGRAELTRINIKNFSFFFLMPAFLLIAFFLVGAGIFVGYGKKALIQYVFLFPIIYSAYSFIIFLSVTLKKKMVSFYIFPCLLTCHFFFPLGIIRGLTQWKLSVEKKKIAYKVVHMDQKSAKNPQKREKLLSELK